MTGERAKELAEEYHFAAHGGDPETEEEAVRIWNMRKWDSCCDAGKERQMPETKNALSELAEWLKKQEGSFPVLANQFPYEDERDMHNIAKVQRIIAELAKVETPYDLVGLVGKCHAIAGGCQEVDAEIPDEDRDENFQENC